MVCKLFTRVIFSKPRFPYSTHTVSKDYDVSAICNSFRKGWNWDIISSKFCSFKLSDSVVEQVLLELKNPSDAKSALSFFHWSAKRMDFKHGIWSYCAVIHILVRARLLTDARALIESVLLKNKECSNKKFSVVDSLLDGYKVYDSHPLVFDLLIQGYAKLRMIDIAFDTCRYMEEHGLSVSLISFNTLLHVVQKTDKRALVWDIYEHMIRKRIYPSVVTLRIMIDALCKDGHLQKIVDALDRIMGKRNSPSVIVNSSLILKVLNWGDMEESMVLVLLKRLLQKNLIPDSVAYSLIVHAKVKLGNLDSSWEMYQEMVKRGFQANSFVYTSFIGAYCREGRIEEANGLMQEMEERDLKPYGETFDHLIIGCANLERLEECLTVCEKMLRMGLIPSCLSFNKMVEKLGKKGEVEQANSMLTVLLDKGFLPNDITYSHLIEGYAKKDKIQEVLKLYYEMEYKSMSPGLSVFTSIIQSLCHCGKLEDAEKYVRIMKGCSLTPSVTIYKTLIASYMQKGDSLRALHLHNEMASLEL
ncbi:hypothetical protein RIF29_20751 [Crotalaria pallida]|uniref:Pentatricopeptide repeat-containing protein n=1 Tax=Crotalaria pallida TaxID=3830 RepID=A0AAN9F5B1_CROPI